METLPQVSRAFTRLAMAAAIFAALSLPSFAESSERGTFDPAQKAKLIEKWRGSSKIAAVLVSGTYQRFQIASDGKTRLDEDAVFTLLQETKPPFRKKLTLSPERSFHSKGYIVWDREIFYGPEQSVVVTTANGTQDGVNKMKMIEICKPDSLGNDFRNLLALSIRALVPAFQPTSEKRWDILTVNDLRNVKVENNGSFTVSFCPGPGYQPIFWKTISADGMRVGSYVVQSWASENELPAISGYGEASGEIAVGEFYFPKALQLWRRLGEDWSLYSYSITRCEAKTTVQEEEFMPH